MMLYYGGICFITDRGLSSLSVEEIVRMVLDAGVRWIQYREKELSRREIYFQAERLRKITAEYRAAFTINDHADIALAVGADGLHLGQDDLPLKEARMIMGLKTIGISTHDLGQAKAAEAGGADYIGYGPIYATTTKEKAESPRGLEGLREVSGAIEIPVVAIGGIKLENIRDVLGAGADAVAVASGILCADDINCKAGEFVKIFEGIRNRTV